MFQEGVSRQEIAERLSAESKMPISYLSVVGVLNRAGLSKPRAETAPEPKPKPAPSVPINTKWTKYKDEIIQMYRDGKTYTQIGLAISYASGKLMTRNAAAGVVDRLGLKGTRERRPRIVLKKPPGFGFGMPRRTPRIDPGVRRGRQDDVWNKAFGPQETDTGPWACHALGADKCHWPVGDPKDDNFRFCVAATDGATYCAEHHAVAYDRSRASV